MEYQVTGPSGMRAKFVSRGATLAELWTPDRNGQMADVVLGFDHEAGYATTDNQHFGCTTGRFANRIALGKFTLDGQEYQLAINNGVNHLHGGSNAISRGLSGRANSSTGQAAPACGSTTSAPTAKRATRQSRRNRYLYAHPGQRRQNRLHRDD